MTTPTLTEKLDRLAERIADRDYVFEEFEDGENPSMEYREVTEPFKALIEVARAAHAANSALFDPSRGIWIPASDWERVKDALFRLGEVLP